MSEITKPDYTYLWSSGGAVVSPSNVKIQTGWTAEVPPFQWENWSQNRQDQAIAHVLQHGISVWDALTEYQAGKSYVQGSDGIIYKAITTNTNQNPVADTSFTNWAPSSSGSLLRTTIYINTGGVLQASVNGGAFANVSSTFTKHPLTSFVEVEVQGAGGSGGGAPVTGGGQVSCGAGGAGGGYSRKRLNSGFTGVTVVVGAGGAAASGVNGNNGGSSSFAGTISATGGAGGTASGPVTANAQPAGGSIPGTGSGGDINSSGFGGAYGVFSTSAIGGAGGGSVFGGGAQFVSGTASGTAAVSYGAGGSGGVLTGASGTPATSGAGKSGVVIVKEFS